MNKYLDLTRTEKSCGKDDNGDTNCCGCSQNRKESGGIGNQKNQDHPDNVTLTVPVYLMRLAVAQFSMKNQ